MCRHPNRVSRQRGRLSDGDSRRYTSLLELSEKDSGRFALFEVPEGEVSVPFFCGTSRDDDEMKINFWPFF